VKDISERPEEIPMYPYSNAEFQLQLFHQRADELQREAAAYRLGRAASGRHVRSGRRSRSAHRAQAARAAAAG
jgi:hypothetical protein